jgi:hypothetical protein
MAGIGSAGSKLVNGIKQIRAAVNDRLGFAAFRSALLVRSLPKFPYLGKDFAATMSRVSFALFDLSVALLYLLRILLTHGHSLHDPR